MTPESEKIADTLFSAVREGESLYAILDTARNIDIHFQLQNITGVEYVSIYKGRKEESMWDATPYLVRCVRNSEYFNWVIEQGWGESWGVFVTSKVGLYDLCKHFQEFLIVKISENREVYFRFYDPRVLRVFLPTCTPEEMQRFFGPVCCFETESDESTQILRFTTGKTAPSRI